MRTSSQKACLAASALLLGACVEPIQYGGRIPIDTAGLGARLESLCTFTGQTVGCAALAPSEEAPTGR